MKAFCDACDVEFTEEMCQWEGGKVQEHFKVSLPRIRINCSEFKLECLPIEMGGISRMFVHDGGYYRQLRSHLDNRTTQKSLQESPDQQDLQNIASLVKHKKRRRRLRCQNWSRKP